jgi:hypothetical protein
VVQIVSGRDLQIEGALETTSMLHHVMVGTWGLGLHASSSLTPRRLLAQKHAKSSRSGCSSCSSGSALLDLRPSARRNYSGVGCRTLAGILGLQLARCRQRWCWLVRASKSAGPASEDDEGSRKIDEDIPTSETIDPYFEQPQWHEPPRGWPPQIPDLWVPLGPHTAATDFIMIVPPASLPRTLIYNALCHLPLNEFDLQARLYPAASHLLTSEQLQRLFMAAGVPTPLQHGLDVGAGDGCITGELRPLCKELIVAETSRGMGRSLVRRYSEDTIKTPRFLRGWLFSCFAVQCA